MRSTYIFLGLLLVITVLAQIVFLFVILVLKIPFFKLLIEFLKLESFASEPINCARDQFLLDILA